MLEIDYFTRAGKLIFDRTSNAVSYQVEWAPAVSGPWSVFTNFPGEGVGPITAEVPIIFRAVEILTNPPPVPAGMSLIPAGEFVMGDTFGEGGSNEMPLHTNFISAFYMDKYEVTQALFWEVRRFGVSNGYDFSSVVESVRTNHPATWVESDETYTWCNARSEKEGLTPVYYDDPSLISVRRVNSSARPYVNWCANGYRLPTEAEWEKAARGGESGQRFPWGDTITHGKANYHSNPDLDYYDVSPTPGYHPSYLGSSSPVGSFAANGYDLYDMAGNVSEWCWDYRDEFYYSVSPYVDPRGGSYIPGYFNPQVVRGGSFHDSATWLRVACRDAGTGASFDTGFRCARGL